MNDARDARPVTLVTGARGGIGRALVARLRAAEESQRTENTFLMRRD